MTSLSSRHLSEGLSAAEAKFKHTGLEAVHPSSGPRTTLLPKCNGDGHRAMIIVQLMMGMYLKVTQSQVLKISLKAYGAKNFSGRIITSP